MDIKCPRISKSLNLLRLPGNGLVSRFLRRAVAEASLKIGVKIDPIGRINVNRLYLPPEALLIKQARHDGKRVSEDEAISPPGLMLIELNLLGPIQIWITKERRLSRFLLDRLENCLCRN